MTTATAAAVTAAAARKFDSTSLAETARRGREGRGVMRASEPEEKTAMAEVRKVRAEKTETEKTEAEKIRADKTADSSEEGQQRCRNLSDVPVRSSRNPKVFGNRANIQEITLSKQLAFLTSLPGYAAFADLFIIKFHIEPFFIAPNAFILL